MARALIINEPEYHAVAAIAAVVIRLNLSFLNLAYQFHQPFYWMRQRGERDTIVPT